MTQSASPSSYLFRRALQLFYQPRSVFDWVASDSAILWKFPLLALTLLTLLRILISGWLQVRRAMQGEIPLPPDWIYYTPEMQAQYMQAAEATKSPVFVYLLPAIIGLATIWLGWVIISSLLHLAFTVVGGRGTNTSALNLVAWASWPFSLREIFRIIYLLIARHPIVSAGLSGFAPVTENGGLAFVSALLSITDIFLIWYIVLLIIGAKRTETITGIKSLAVVLSILTLSLAAQAGMSYLGSRIGGMMVTRPFFF